MLEALTHQLGETSPGALDYLSLTPLEYFQRQIFACFWFEHGDITHSLELLGADNILFETDFPHPTCLYPDSMVAAAPALEKLSDGRTAQGAAGQRCCALPHPSPALLTGS